MHDFESLSEKGVQFGQTDEMIFKMKEEIFVGGEEKVFLLGGNERYDSMSRGKAQRPAQREMVVVPGRHGTQYYHADVLHGTIMITSAT